MSPLKELINFIEIRILSTNFKELKFLFFFCFVFLFIYSLISYTLICCKDFSDFKDLNTTFLEPTGSSDTEEPEIVIEASTPVVQLSTGDYFRIM
jgi:hypothetical protein